MPRAKPASASNPLPDLRLLIAEGQRRHWAKRRAQEEITRQLRENIATGKWLLTDSATKKPVPLPSIPE